MKGSFKLFRIFGIDIKLHFSWWIVFALLAWSLSTAFFPQFYPNLTVKTYWTMGLLSSLLLFVSVLLHELSHSLVAKAKKINVESITLFFFGGVASITDEDLKPKDELQMSLAGPAFSLLLSFFFYLIYKFNGSLVFTGITFYLYQLNLILALFNLIPGYPLDGGRAFRAVLYAYYKDLKKATYIASKGGKFFAGILIFLGLFGIITGKLNGFWFLLLGGFLYFIANASYEQVLIKQAISQFSVKKLFHRQYKTVPAEQIFNLTLKKVYPTEQNCFVVKENKKYAGILDLKRINNLKGEIQKKIKVKEIMVPKQDIKPVNLGGNGYQAFKLLMEQEMDLLPVISKEKMVGVISKKTVMYYLLMELKYNLSTNCQKEADHHRSKTDGMLASLGSASLDSQKFHQKRQDYWSSNHQSKTGGISVIKKKA